jgi:hypothetical protein
MDQPAVARSKGWGRGEPTVSLSAIDSKQKSPFLFIITQILPLNPTTGVASTHFEVAGGEGPSSAEGDFSADPFGLPVATAPTEADPAGNMSESRTNTEPEPESAFNWSEMDAVFAQVQWLWDDPIHKGLFGYANSEEGAATNLGLNNKPGIDLASSLACRLCLLSSLFTPSSDLGLRVVVNTSEASPSSMHQLLQQHQRLLQHCPNRVVLLHASEVQPSPLKPTERCTTVSGFEVRAGVGAQLYGRCGILPHAHLWKQTRLLELAASFVTRKTSLPCARGQPLTAESPSALLVWAQLTHGGTATAFSLTQPSNASLDALLQMGQQCDILLSAATDVNSPGTFASSRKVMHRATFADILCQCQDGFLSEPRLSVEAYELLHHYALTARARVPGSNPTLIQSLVRCAAAHSVLTTWVMSARSKRHVPPQLKSGTVSLLDAGVAVALMEVTLRSQYGASPLEATLLPTIFQVAAESRLNPGVLTSTERPSCDPGPSLQSSRLSEWIASVRLALLGSTTTE